MSAAASASAAYGSSFSIGRLSSAVRLERSRIRAFVANQRDAESMQGQRLLEPFVQARNRRWLSCPEQPASLSGRFASSRWAAPWLLTAIVGGFELK